MLHGANKYMRAYAPTCAHYMPRAAGAHHEALCTQCSKLSISSAITRIPFADLLNVEALKRAATGDDNAQQLRAVWLLYAMDKDLAPSECVRVDVVLNVSHTSDVDRRSLPVPDLISKLAEKMFVCALCVHMCICIISLDMHT